MDLAAPGGVNAPAGASTADVMSVFGMISLVRLHHLGAAVITGGIRGPAAHRNNRAREVMTFTRLSAPARACLLAGLPFNQFNTQPAMLGSLLAFIARQAQQDIDCRIAHLVFWLMDGG